MIEIEEKKKKNEKDSNFANERTGIGSIL